MLLRLHWWLRHGLLRSLAVSLFFKRIVIRGARRMGRRDQPFKQAAADGSLGTVRGEYQKYAAGHLEKWVMSVKSSATRPLSRAAGRCKRAETAVPERQEDRDRCAEEAAGARTPLLGQAKGWLTGGLVFLLLLDVSVAYSPIEQLGMPGPMTLLFAMAVVLLLNGLAAAVGWVAYRVWVEPDRSISFAAERMLKVGIAVALLIIGVVVYEFARLRAETGYSVLWGAVSVASVLLALLLGVMHHGDAPHRNLKRAERRLARGKRRVLRACTALDWKTDVAAACGLHQRAVVTGVLARADEKYSDTYMWRNRGQAAPTIPDPCLMTEAEIVKRVLGPLGDRRTLPPGRPALEPGL